LAAEPQFRAKTTHHQFDLRATSTLAGQQFEDHSVDNTATMSTEYDNLSSDLIWEIARKHNLPTSPKPRLEIGAEGEACANDGLIVIKAKTTPTSASANKPAACNSPATRST
jgi:hypothetical protein